MYDENFRKKSVGTTETGARDEFKSLINYLEKTFINIVMISEISRTDIQC